MKAFRKTVALLLSVAFVCAMAIMLAGCGPSIESLEISKAPAKTECVEGQKFDPQGMEVTAVYDNDEKEVVTDYTYAPAGELKTTDTEITITYDGKTVTQKITVVAKTETEITVTKQPKTEYKIGEKFDATGMEVKAKYNDDSETVITDYTVKPSRPLNANDQNVYITAGETMIALPITVTAEDGVTYKDPLPEYKARGTTDLAGQSANVNFTFYDDGTVKGLVESGAGSMVDNILGNYISLPGVWERTEEEFYVVMNDFVFDPSTLSGLASFVEGTDMEEMFNQLIEMDPIEIEGCMSQIDAKADGSISYDLTITAMGIQAPFSCTGNGAPDSLAVKAGDALEAEFGDFSGMQSSSTSSAIKILSGNTKASHGYVLQYTCRDGNVWKMTVDTDKATENAAFAFYFAGYKKVDGAYVDISKYITLKVNGEEVELKGDLSSSSNFIAYNTAADIKAGENTIELTWTYKDDGSAPNIKFDYLTIEAGVTILNPSFGEL